MFCKMCGRQTDGRDICEECERKRDAGVTVGAVQDSAGKDSARQDRMYGFGKALASTIMSVGGFFIGLIAWIFSIIAVASYYAEIRVYDGELPIQPIIVSTSGSISMLVIALGLSAAALVLGIISVRRFAEAKRKGFVKPIPAFVLGLVGIITSACTVLIVLCSFILLTLI